MGLWGDLGEEQSGRGNSQCKGPEAECAWHVQGNSKGASVAAAT